MGQTVRGVHRKSRFMVEIRNFLVNNLLLLYTLVGVAGGITIGFLCRNVDLQPNNYLLLIYPGELFMRVLKLMILPLIVASLIAGSASLNARVNGKIALRTLIYFVLTSLFNAFLGICLALAIHPGNPGTKNLVEDKSESSNQITVLDSLLDLGRNLFPDNLFQAAFQQAHTAYIPKNLENNSFDLRDANFIAAPLDKTRILRYRSGTNTIGIVFFCLCFGTVVGTLGERGKVIVDFFSAVFEAIMKMVSCIMWFTPVGVCSVIAGKIAVVKEIDEIISQLGWFVVTVAIGVLFYQLVIAQLIYFFIVKKNPFTFYWGLIQATLTASLTASTAAALPVTFRCMNDNLKVDPRITRFVLPIGCNINMDGTALFVAIASIFIAQMNGIYLGLGQLFIVLLASTAASLSSASVPSAALVLILLVLSAINVPAADVSLLFAIDWFVDRIRTTNNMLGDCYAAAVVEVLSKKELMECDETIQEEILLNPRPDSLGVEYNESITISKGTCSPDTTILEMDVLEENCKNIIKA